MVVISALPEMTAGARAVSPERYNDAEAELAARGESGDDLLRRFTRDLERHGIGEVKGPAPAPCRPRSAGPPRTARSTS